MLPRNLPVFVRNLYDLGLLLTVPGPHVTPPSTFIYNIYQEKLYMTLNSL